MKTFPTKRIIPSHRVSIDRRTGQEVGPRVPVDPADWPYGILHPAEILWRYLDSWKFEDMLAKSAIYFARQDRLKDPFEGRFSEGNSNEFSASDKALNDAYKFNRTLAEAKAHHEGHRCCVFISCWHRNSCENREMWDAYTENAESVVVTTSANALERFISDIIMKSPVKSHHRDFQRTEFDWNALSFYKHSNYGFEREFRMLRTLQENESVSLEDSVDYGRNVQVRLRKIIHRVITHPKADEKYKLKIDTLLATYLKGIKRQDSFLLK